MMRSSDGSVRTKLTFLAILSLGTALRLYDLGGPSLWTDEGATRWLAALPMAKMQEALRLDFVNLPLFLTLENLLESAMGDSEIALRIASAVFGILCIPLIYRLGFTAGGGTGALVASGFWALHPMTIWYSREARPYSLAALLAAIVLLLFLRLWTEETRSRWIGAGIALALGLITHYFFILVAAALVLLSLAEFRNRPRFFRKWAFLSLASGIPLAIILGWFLSQPDPSLTIGWIQRPGIAVFPGTLANLLTGYGGHLSLLNGLALLSGTILIALGLRSGQYRRAAGVGILVPLLAVWIFSQRRPIYMDRYFIVLLPFFALLIGRGAARLHDIAAKFRFTWPLLLTLAILQGMTVHTDPKYDRENWRAVSELIASSPAPVWLSETHSILPFGYYHGESYAALDAPSAEACGSQCWWTLRQPYTTTHAFTQAIEDQERPWLPDPPAGCEVSSAWDDGSGIVLWRLRCDTG